MSASQTSPKNNRISPRWLQSIEHFVFSGDLVACLLATILLLMPALALEAAAWPLQLKIAIPTLVASIIFGYFLAHSRYDELTSLLLSTVYSIVAVLLIAGFQQNINPVRGVEEVLARAIEWTYDLIVGGINQDDLVFTLVVSLLFWFFGYNAAWHIFRIDRVWRVLIPPGMILLVNMVVYTGEVSLELYLLLYVFVALLLIVRSSLDAREWDWYVNQVRVPRRMDREFNAVGLGLSALVLALAWLIPTGTLQEQLDSFQEFLASDPVRQASEFWNRLVEPIESEGPATADYYGSDTLRLGGAIQLGDQIVMLVDADTQHRYYWRSRVFERYEGGRWAPSATRRVPDLSAPLEVIEPPNASVERVDVTQEITVNAPTRLIYSAPQPRSVSLAGRIDLLRISPDQDDASAAMNVSVIRPLRVLERGDTYSAVSSISTASAIDLRAASSAYPDWVLNPNAYAAGISPRVASLARDIVNQSSAVTAYDQTKAIESWLRNEIAYNEQILGPPVGADSLEWFLFEQREGYCTYYATAMVAMLRTLGIPSRMAAGFAQGEYDPSLDAYIIRERDAHTWVEVYFPGYGWINFEPTAAQEPIDREGDFETQDTPPETLQQPTLQPTNTPTPSPTPTIIFTPTLEDDDSAEEEQNQFNEAPTATPSFTPTPPPTATPVIVPTIAPPIPPETPPNDGFLSFILPALLIAALVFAIFLLLVLILLLIYWWWEWRGFGGLSPVARAYARLERYLTLIGWRSPENNTPEERRTQIVQQLPQAERPVTAITRRYTYERYSGRRPEKGTPEFESDQDFARTAWSDARGNILQRWLRRFIPFRRD